MNPGIGNETGSENSAGPPAPAGRLFRGAHASSMLSLLGLVGLGAFSTTSIPVLLPAITGDLGQLALSPWVVTGFLLTSTLIIPIAGRSLDILGLPRAFRWSSLLFALASAVCGLAPSMQVLVVSRALQGAAAGFGLTIAVAGIGVAIPAPLRARAFAANASIWGVLAVAAPLLASLIAPLLTWRGVFLLNGIVGCGIALLGWNRLPDSTKLRPQNMDPVGFLLLAVVTVVLTLGVARSGMGALVAVAISAAFLIGYWFHSAHHPSPVFERAVFVNYPFGHIHIVGTVAFGAASGLSSYLPFYVGITLGGTATDSAFAVGSLSVGWALAMIIVARIMDRTSEATVGIIGYAITVPAMLLTTTEFALNTGLLPLIVTQVLLGAGAGTVSAAMLTLLQASSTATNMGQATAVHQFTKNIGYTVSAALIGMLIVQAVESSVEPGVAEQILAGELIIEDDLLRDAIADGFRLSGVVMTGFSIVAAAFAWRLYRLKPSRHQRTGSD
jgi:MFS family permease